MDFSDMGTDEKFVHNPDSENLKSLLKKSDRKVKKQNRVIFNENKNEFFDADYIILIREECEYDDDEDDICTCNQHEITHISCDPSCNCTVFDELENVPQSPKFAPPFEFVDAATLSPPEEYKDMEMKEHKLFALQKITREQRTIICKECRRVNHEDNDIHYIMELPNNSSELKDNVLNKVENKTNSSESILKLEESSATGILKGGRFWKQENNFTIGENTNSEMVRADDDGYNRRTVRFVQHTEEKRTNYESLDISERNDNKTNTIKPVEEISNNLVPSGDSEIISFKLGNHILIPNNSLKPNSAVRQLFPSTKPTTGKHSESANKYLITAESLRAFEETEVSTMPELIQSGNTNENIKRVIERNTLRRSLIRNEPKNKKNIHKVDNSLVELIKQLTCNDDEENKKSDDVATQVNPTENITETLEVNCDLNKCNDKTYSPSSSSTSSNSSTNSSTYKKISDLFNKREKACELPSVINTPKPVPTVSDINESSNIISDITKLKVTSISESRKPFLASFAPLTACVGHVGNSDDFYYDMNNTSCERKSLTKTVNSDYTLGVVDGKIDKCKNIKYVTPDVLAGTPVLDSRENMALFIDQDVNRTAIKIKCQPDGNYKDEEHDDYGFNKRPNVQGIKAKFGTLTTVLNQTDNELDLHVPSASVVWPYYSQNSLTRCVPAKKVINQNNANCYYSLPEELKNREHNINIATQDDTIYEKCPTQMFFETFYKSKSCTYPISSNPRCNGRFISGSKYRKPSSPPPQEITRNSQQTLVYIPYNDLQRYQPVISPNTCYQFKETLDTSSQNQIHQGYTEPIYDPQQVQRIGYFCNPKILSSLSYKTNKTSIFKSYQPFSTVSSKDESSFFGPFFSARATQTLTTSLPMYNCCSDMKPRKVDSGCSTDKIYRNVSCNLSSPRDEHEEANTENDSLDNRNEYYLNQLSNSFRQSLELNNYLPQNGSIPAPTEKLIEAGVPESVITSTLGPTDIIHNTSIVSPCQSQNSSSKFVFYAMNV